jgi:hypothetical protein
MSTEHAVPDPVAVRRYLRALHHSAPPSALVEVRFRLGHGMGQAFHPASALDTAAETILTRTGVTDVFVGVVPRSRRGGGRADLIAPSTVVWADCDDADSIAALNAFRPPPSMVIASGTGRNRHAYWLLGEAISLDQTESLNRRLALALGADPRSADAARTLRPAGSLNHKRNPPNQVQLLRLTPRLRLSIAALDAALPPDARTPTREAAPLAADPLRAISPRAYVPCLTGQRTGRSGKIRCPFHDDHTPSLHVYEDPGRGWYCYGCGRGGSSYDLAALLWQRGTLGNDFLKLRHDLQGFLARGREPD